LASAHKDIPLGSATSEEIAPNRGLSSAAESSNGTLMIVEQQR